MDLLWRLSLNSFFGLICRKQWLGFSLGFQAVILISGLGFLKAEAGIGFFNRFLRGVQTVTVDNVYATNSNWNSYVKNNNGGTNAYDQPDTACTGSEVGYYEVCIHGGEKRRVVLNGVSSCTNLTITDSLGAWRWRCIDSTGTAIFYTHRLADGKGLADLIDTSSNTWRSNFIEVRNSGNLIAKSSPAVWGWNNTITGLPDNSGSGLVTLSTAGTIYTLNASRTTGGYNINADRIALVINPAATLSHRNSSTNTCYIDSGENAANDHVCTVAVGSQSFVWIEGKISGYAPNTTWNDAGLVTVSMKFSRLHNVTLTGTNKFGWFSRNIISNYFKDLKITNRGSANAWCGATDWSGNGGGQYNRWLRFSLHQTTNGNQLVSAYEFWNSIFNSVRASGGTYGFAFSYPTRVTVVNLIGSATSQKTFEIYGGTQMTSTHLTIANGGPNATAWGAATNVTVDQILSVNNDWTGIQMGDLSSNAKFYNMVSYGNEGSGFWFGNMTGNYFGRMATGGNDTPGWGAANCVYVAPVTGVADPDGGGPLTCGNGSGSSATWSESANLSNTFVGKVTSNDVANASDVNGLQAYSSITDWANFDNFFRLWANDGSATFPATDQNSVCNSGNCRIWDWSLRSSDTAILNKSGDGVSTNDNFVVGSTCPQAVHGNRAITDTQSPANTFLENATEIMDDDIGDDDGLCESNEACVYSPNFGAYQGHGGLSTGTCNFQNGTVTNVQMYRYNTNGY